MSGGSFSKTIVWAKFIAGSLRTDFRLFAQAMSQVGALALTSDECRIHRAGKFFPLLDCVILSGEKFSAGFFNHAAVLFLYSVIIDPHQHNLAVIIF